jgi:ketosteroid isomerase-like protein
MIKDEEIIREQGKLLRILRKQKDGSWRAARAIAQNDMTSENE